MNCIERILECKPSILVVGDIMLDHYIYGEVDRVSPEAPVPVLKPIKAIIKAQKNQPGQ